MEFRYCLFEKLSPFYFYFLRKVKIPSYNKNGEKIGVNYKRAFSITQNWSDATIAFLEHLELKLVHTFFAIKKYSDAAYWWVDTNEKLFEIATPMDLKELANAVLSTTDDFIVVYAKDNLQFRAAINDDKTITLQKVYLKTVSTDKPVAYEFNSEAAQEYDTQLKYELELNERLSKETLEYIKEDLQKEIAATNLRIQKLQNEIHKPIMEKTVVSNTEVLTRTQLDRFEILKTYLPCTTEELVQNIIRFQPCINITPEIYKKLSSRVQKLLHGRRTNLKNIIQTRHLIWECYRTYQLDYTDINIPTEPKETYNARFQKELRDSYSCYMQNRRTALNELVQHINQIDSDLIE